MRRGSRIAVLRQQLRHRQSLKLMYFECEILFYMYTVVVIVSNFKFILKQNVNMQKLICLPNNIKTHQTFDAVYRKMTYFLDNGFYSEIILNALLIPYLRR